MIMGWGAVTSGAHILWAALNRYLDADGMRQGAAVSFYAAFSMAPRLVGVAGSAVWPWVTIRTPVRQGIRAP